MDATDPADALTALVRGLVTPIVKQAVADALAEHGRDAEPEPLLDRAGVGRLIGASLPKIDKLVADGLPSMMVGGTRRFERMAVLAWLRARGGAS